MKLFVALSLFAASAFASTAPAVPEIDATSATGAIALVAGGLMVLRGRRKK